MKVAVDRTACVGSGSCAQVAPTVFRLAADGSLEVLQEEPGDDLRRAVEDASEICPTAAITVEG